MGGMTKIASSPPIPDAEWRAAPSPCVGVCRYDALKGRCIACAMAREDKRAFKRMGGVNAADERRLFFVRTVRRLARQGGLMAWLAAYAAKCAKQGRGDVTRGL